MITCKICQSPTEPVGIRRGRYIQQDFELRRCTACHFSFVANPCLDSKQIYGDDYYAGKGADSLVDYAFELQNPDLTIRQYEWRGIERAVLDCVPVKASTRWLDFGCGTGGLVRYCRDQIRCEAFGFDSGDVHECLRDLGDRLLNEGNLESSKASFDVITAIEVLEHVEDPVAVLRLIRSLLKPGGLFFCTTGNAEPFRQNLPAWTYVIPEIHISFFEPSNLAGALERAGFRPEFAGFGPGFEDILRFKILKNLRFRKAGLAEKLLPWRLLSRIADARYKVSAHPRGWAV
jgi:SAM-dependent methyltransferase